MINYSTNIEKHLSGTVLFRKGYHHLSQCFSVLKSLGVTNIQGQLSDCNEGNVCIFHYTSLYCNDLLFKKTSQTPNQKQTGKTASCKASVRLTKVYLLYVNGSCLCYSCILIKLFLIYRRWNQNSVHGELQPPGAGLRCKNKQPSDTGSTAGQTMP